MDFEVVTFPQPVPYKTALQIQEELVVRRLEDEIRDTVLILEHGPVITLGVRARQEHLLLSPEVLARRGIEVLSSPRGGDVTFHGPGQLILYLVMKLKGANTDVHAFVSRLEETAILTAATYGIEATRRKGKTGIWTSQGKLAAIGVRFRKWVSSHGMSFNVNVDLDGFATIVPCGLHGERVTSLAALQGKDCPALSAVRETLVSEFRNVMARTR